MSKREGHKLLWDQMLEVGREYWKMMIAGKKTESNQKFLRLKFMQSKTGRRKGKWNTNLGFQMINWKKVVQGRVGNRDR